MFDHQHGFVMGDPLHQSRNPLNILMGHSSGWLVEQDHFWIEGQSSGNFQSAFAAIGQFGSLFVLQIKQADISKKPARLIVIL